MSFAVARMTKLKADNLVGIGNHDQRKTTNHSNEDIDVSRSHLNYDLVAGRTNNFKTDYIKVILNILLFHIKKQ
ncbi:Plasmid recombination enzyme [Lactococcus chungangensis CAU 28 = DSM 22330]|nr:Plasmid recombination enzyme [Lactococcus chungangensis CAU 28 = DSM 22330]